MYKTPVNSGINYLLYQLVSRISSINSTKGVTHKVQFSTDRPKALMLVLEPKQRGSMKEAHLLGKGSWEVGMVNDA